MIGTSGIEDDSMYVIDGIVAVSLKSSENYQNYLIIYGWIRLALCIEVNIVNVDSCYSDHMPVLAWILQ